MQGAVAESGEMSDKSQAILKALAQGRSCDQILAADRTLTYHDIFRAAAELPETQRNPQWPGGTRNRWQHQAKSGGRGAEKDAATKVRD